VYLPHVIEMVIGAMLALDSHASCVYFADLKENDAGVACITEINAGRFSNMPTAHDALVGDSMCSAYVRAAFDEPVEPQAPLGRAEECYVMRGRDDVPIAIYPDDLLEGILQTS
jgi:carbamoyl-phosphate synthase large subunit